MSSDQGPGRCYGPLQWYGLKPTGLDDSSLELQVKLDEEFAQLSEDHCMLRDSIFPRQDPANAHYLPVNLQCIVQNTIQIIHIDRRKLSDLEPTHIIDSICELCDRLIVVHSDDALTQESQSNATLKRTPSLSVYLMPEISTAPVLAKNIQQELPYTSLCTVTAAIEIWYDPEPHTIIIEEDAVFIESFFTIPDEDIEVKMHLQSPWLLC